MPSFKRPQVSDKMFKKYLMFEKFMKGQIKLKPPPKTVEELIASIKKSKIYKTMQKMSDDYNYGILIQKLNEMSDMAELKKAWLEVKIVYWIDYACQNWELKDENEKFETFKQNWSEKTMDDKYSSSKSLFEDADNGLKFFRQFRIKKTKPQDK